MSRPTEGGPNEKAPTTFSLGRPLPLLQFFNLAGQIAPLSGKLPKQHSYVGIPCRKRLIIALMRSLQKLCRRRCSLARRGTRMLTGRWPLFHLKQTYVDGPAFRGCTITAEHLAI